MNESQKLFRERLLAAENTTPTLKDQHEKELHMLIEQELTGGRKWAAIGSIVICGALALFFAAMAGLAPRGLPVLARVAFVLGSVFSMAGAIQSARVLKKGTFNLKSDASSHANLIWGFLVVMVTIFMLLAPGDKLWGIQMVLNGLVFLVGGAVLLIRNCVEQAELQTREKLLKLEYQLAEIREQIKSQKSE